MLTVKEACALFFTPKEITLSMDGRQYTIKYESQKSVDEITMGYFGDFLVEDISAVGEDEFFISVKMKPMKKEDIA